MIGGLERAILSRDWSQIRVDAAYMSHHHAVEVIGSLSFEHGLVALNTHFVGTNEYRNSFISIDTQREFSVSTIFYPDSSTYTFIHLGGEDLGTVLELNGALLHRLSNANIRRPEDRAKRALEIEFALQDLGVISEPQTKEKKEKDASGIVSTKGADGLYTLDYSRVGSGKIDHAERVIDYRTLDGVRHDGKKSSKDD